MVFISQKGVWQGNFRSFFFWGQADIEHRQDLTQDGLFAESLAHCQDCGRAPMGLG